MSKRYYLIILVLICRGIVLHAQTNVSGFISINTNWNLAGSPYIVIGNTLVMQGVTLTIDPGVVVKFDTSRAIQIDGTLIATGTASNRITFTSNKAVQAAGDWGRIQFSDSCIDASYDTNGNYMSGCIMKYCDVLYGGKIIGTGTAAVEMHYSSAYISNCRVISSGGTGILCEGSSVKLDSSSIKYCTGYGIYLGPFHVSTGPCPLSIQYDTISFNTNGGIGFSNAGSPCNQLSIRVRINNNYFNGNTGHGALFSENNFLDKLVLAENIFENNVASQSPAAGGAYLELSSRFVIECNRFINNQGPNRGALFILTGSLGIGFVRSNIFEGNTSTLTSSYNCTVGIQNNSTNNEVHFTNNILRNNVAPGGSSCSFAGFSLIPPMTPFQIDSNEFINNQASRTIYLDEISGLTYQLATLSYNNFLNSNCQFDIYNNCPYGGANIDADSNYWNGTNTQHIDSVIYDFFDDANKSVVFYLPILISATVIDTTCSTIPASISSIEINSYEMHLYPNPASAYVTISFEKNIREGIVEIFNILGIKVYKESIYEANKKEIKLQTISNGIYLVKVFDGKRHYFNKIIVEHDS